MKHFFRNPNEPTMNELIFYIQVRFPELVDEMKRSDHASSSDEPNIYHTESSIWTHTCMVCQRAEISSELDYNKISLITALLHDLGKPESREEVDFESKNRDDSRYMESMIDYMSNKELKERFSSEYFDFKNKSILEFREYLKSLKKKTKVRFFGHEGISFFKAIPVVQDLKKLGILNQEEMEDILTIISMHGTLFDSIDSNGDMKKESKVFDKFEYTERGINLFNNFILQVKHDSTGRFFTSLDGRKNNAYRLGIEIFTEKQFRDYKESKIEVKREMSKSSLTVLIGPPGSGKSTLLKSKDTQDAVIISRDDILMEYAKEIGILGSTYSEVWSELTDENQKTIDRLLDEKFREVVKDRKSIIIDMTNCSAKSQRKWKNKVPKNYSTEAIVIATGYDEVFKRLNKRKEETGKDIPHFVVKNMMRSYMVPDYSVFDKITFSF